MTMLFYRKIDAKEKVKLTQACELTIDLLREKLHLEKWECYFVIKTLFEEFPLEDLEKEEVKP